MFVSVLYLGHMEGSINEGIQKWLGYKGRSHLEMDDFGAPLFQETSIYSSLHPPSAAGKQKRKSIFSDQLPRPAESPLIIIDHHRSSSITIDHHRSQSIIINHNH